MAETRNIVVLGASFAGLSIAHYLARHTLPKLIDYKEANYVVHLIDPSTHFWWHIGAPREIVSVKSMPHDKYFVPIKNGFKQYPAAVQEKILFHQGKASGIDITARTVTYTPAGSETPETLPYYALFIATGVSSPTPLTTLHGDHTISIKALDEMNVKLATAKSVLISGGGPVGVETAGELATHLHGKAEITLVTGSDKLLPVFKKSRADKAAKLLEKHGVKVQYNTRVTGSTEAAGGQTTVTFKDGSSQTVDVYIPAAGVLPNTEFLPAELKNEKGYVKTNPATLRVDAAGPRVYAVGDVAGVDRGGVLKLYGSLPIVGNNFNLDVLGAAKLGSFTEKKYTRKDEETQLVPIGAKAGVAAFNGWGMPQMMVSMFKGKDYMAGQIPTISEGTQWKKP